MTQKERDIYSNLFDITEKNLTDSGMQPRPAYKETLMAALELDPVNTDLSGVYNIPAKKFMQVLYYLLFQKVAAEDEEARFNIEDYSSEDEYRKAVLKDAFESTERAIHKKAVTNYVDFSNADIKTVGKAKRKIRRIITKIKAAIPLKYKMAVKKVFLKIFK